MADFSAAPMERSRVLQISHADYQVGVEHHRSLLGGSDGGTQPAHAQAQAQEQEQGQGQEQGAITSFLSSILPALASGLVGSSSQQQQPAASSGPSAAPPAVSSRPPSLPPSLPPPLPPSLPPSQPPAQPPAQADSQDAAGLELSGQRQGSPGAARTKGPPRMRCSLSPTETAATAAAAARKTVAFSDSELNV